MTNAENDLPPNVISGAKLQDDEVVRPDWVPANAQWINGMWYVNSRPVFPFAIPVPPEVVRAQYIAADQARLEATRAGLPPGYYRHGGVVRDGKGKVASDLPGGYSEDGSHLPGYAEDRAARLAEITEARAVELQAIADLEAAQVRRDEAAARRFRSHNVAVD